MKPEVAIYKDFLIAYSKIPKSQQKRVRDFLDKFIENPTSRSINYEKLHNLKDSKIRSVRINDCYRAIIVKPDEGNVFLLVWVDHHDEAIRWVKNKVFKINDYTGALQVINYDYKEIIKNTTGEENKNEDEQSFLRDMEDDNLLVFGVPYDLLPLIKKVSNVAELLGLKKYLPEEAFEGIYYLLSGYKIEEVLEIVCNKKKHNTKALNTNNIRESLENNHTKVRFRIISNNNELKDILDKPFEEWKVFLHPSYRKIAEINYKGSVKVLGSAGTGKTVLAAYRAKYLAKLCEHKEDKVLFITANEILVRYVKEKLKVICNKKILKKIEIYSFENFVLRLKEQLNINEELVTIEQQEEILQTIKQKKGANYQANFFIEELEEIIEPLNITCLEEYLNISRTGRIQRLSKKQRILVWEVITTYRTYLKDNGLATLSIILKKLMQEELIKNMKYMHVIIDEAQDYNQGVFIFFRSLIPKGENDIFIVGDTQQRFRRKNVVLSNCGINIKGRRSKNLTINYRTTLEIDRYANKFLEGLTFDDLDSKKILKRNSVCLINGIEPCYNKFATFFHELEFVNNKIRELLSRGFCYSQICISSKKEKILQDIYIQGLNYYQIPYTNISNQENNGVNICVMRDLQGMEFRVVFIVGIESDINNLESEQDKCLYYMSCTRARELLFLSSFK